MSGAPEISVVMGVRNAAASLPDTLDSLLEQREVESELIVVDDGSTDGTWSVLERAASQDERVRPLRQAAQGLTVALATGCQAARAPLVVRHLYRKVGGYRPVFRFAQDLDLWLRLVDHGPHVLVPRVLVEAAHRPTSTTFLHHRLQVRFARLALEAARLRRSGRPEAAALEAAGHLARRPPGPPSRADRAAGHYHVASRLRRTHPEHARRHYREALALAPWHVKSWERWLTTRG